MLLHTNIFARGKRKLNLNLIRPLYETYSLQDIQEPMKLQHRDATSKTQNIENSIQIIVFFLKCTIRKRVGEENFRLKKISD